MEVSKCVYRFGADESGVDVTEGDASLNYVLGGKGANLAEMCRLGLPVPPGFTITWAAREPTWPRCAGSICPFPLG